MATKRKVEDEEVRFITEVPTGEFIRSIAPKTGRVMQRVYILDGYDRSQRKYVAHAFDDINQEIYLAPTRKVLVGSRSDNSEGSGGTSTQKSHPINSAAPAVMRCIERRPHE